MPSDRRMELVEVPEQKYLERRAREQHSSRQGRGGYLNGSLTEIGRAAPVIDILEKAVRGAERSHAAGCETADWFNNNFPGVGWKVPYQSRPAEPVWLR